MTSLIRLSHGRTATPHLLLAIGFACSGLAASAHPAIAEAWSARPDTVIHGDLARLSEIVASKLKAAGYPGFPSGCDEPDCLPKQAFACQVLKRELHQDGRYEARGDFMRKVRMIQDRADGFVQAAFPRPFVIDIELGGPGGSIAERELERNRDERRRAERPIQKIFGADRPYFAGGMLIYTSWIDYEPRLLPEQLAGKCDCVTMHFYRPSEGMRLLQTQVLTPVGDDEAVWQQVAILCVHGAEQMKCYDDWYVGNGTFRLRLALEAAPEDSPSRKSNLASTDSRARDELSDVTYAAKAVPVMRLLGARFESDAGAKIELVVCKPGIRDKFRDIGEKLSH